MSVRGLGPQVPVNPALPILPQQSGQPRAPNMRQSSIAPARDNVEQAGCLSIICTTLSNAASALWTFIVTCGGLCNRENSSNNPIRQNSEMLRGLLDGLEVVVRDLRVGRPDSAEVVQNVLQQVERLQGRLDAADIARGGEHAEFNRRAERIREDLRNRFPSIAGPQRAPEAAPREAIVEAPRRQDAPPADRASAPAERAEAQAAGQADANPAIQDWVQRVNNQFQALYLILPLMRGQELGAGGRLHYCLIRNHISDLPLEQRQAYQEAIFNLDTPMLWPHQASRAVMYFMAIRRDRYPTNLPEHLAALTARLQGLNDRFSRLTVAEKSEAWDRITGREPNIRSQNARAVCEEFDQIALAVHTQNPAFDTAVQAGMEAYKTWLGAELRNRVAAFNELNDAQRDEVLGNLASEDPIAPANLEEVRQACRAQMRNAV